jgi:hypothetical protein
MAAKKRGGGPLVTKISKAFRVSTLGLVAPATVFAVLASPSTADAQSSGVAQAVLALPSITHEGTRIVNGRLYGGNVRATITDQDRSPNDFNGSDTIVFSITPRIGTARGLNFSGTRPQFDQWVKDNASDLLRILFPGNISTGVTGHDTAQLYSQQLLLTTALGTDAARQTSPRNRSGAGGLVESEWFQRDGHQSQDSGWAWQGLYGIGRALSLQGRFTEQREDTISTHATTAAVDYHPYVEIERSVIWRVGATARSGLLYSQSAAMNLGSLDYGGGAWMSVRKNFSHVRIGGGSLFQGSKSWVPTALTGKDYEFLAQAINQRGIAYDVAYGGTIAVDTSTKTAVIAKHLETRTVHSEETRTPLKLWLVGFSYTLGPFSALDFGFKASSASPFRAKSLFMQGNFGW